MRLSFVVRSLSICRTQFHRSIPFQRKWRLLLTPLALVILEQGGFAQPQPIPKESTGVVSPQPCQGPLHAEAVIRCALAQSLEVRSSEQDLQALQGRRTSAGTWLPSRPTLSATLGDRRPFGGAMNPPGGVSSALNWSVGLSQEVEIAGQRGTRLREVDAEMLTQNRKIRAVEQEVAATALFSFYDLLAAQEELRLATDLSKIAESLSAWAQARAKESLVSWVDADVAQAEATRLQLDRLEVERRLNKAQTVFLQILGSSTPVELAGDLEQGPQLEDNLSVEGLLERALTLRGELSVADAEREQRQAQIERLKRERIPNPTFSFFAQNDGFNERVLGFGVSIPLPLPSPVAPSRAGEIATARVQVAQADTNMEMIRRRVRREVTQAWAQVQACTTQRRLFPPELLSRAQKDLRALTQGLTAKQLSIREALFSQRTLIELLQRHLQTRLICTQARIELIRAVGISFLGKSL